MCMMFILARRTVIDLKMPCNKTNLLTVPANFDFTFQSLFIYDVSYCLSFYRSWMSTSNLVIHKSLDIIVRKSTLYLLKALEVSFLKSKCKMLMNHGRCRRGVQNEESRSYFLRRNLHVFDKFKNNHLDECN